MNAYNIISYLRRGYFLFPSGVFEKRLCELLVAKNKKSTSQEDTEKCKRLIEYTFGEGKFPKEYIKGFEHINLENEENVSQIVQTLAADANVSIEEECTEEKCLKLIDKTFGLDHAGYEDHTEEILSEADKNENSIVISKDLDDIFAENTPVCVPKVVVFRPTWPPQGCSYQDPNSNVGDSQASSNNYTRFNEKKNKKDEENNMNPVVLATTTTFEENIPRISVDHRVMIEPHIDIYADEEEDLVCQRKADSNLEMAEREPKKLSINLIVCSHEKTEPVERNQSQNSSTVSHYHENDIKSNNISEPEEKKYSQNNSTISPHHVNVKTNVSNIDPVGVDVTGLEKTILQSLINNTVGSKNPFPFQVKWETCQAETLHLAPSKVSTLGPLMAETAHLAPSKVSRLDPLREETTHLDPPTVENIARFDAPQPETKETEPREIPILSLGKSSIHNCTTQSPSIGEQNETWNQKSAKAEVHLDPPTIENISRLDRLIKKTKNIDSSKVKSPSFDTLTVQTKKPETKVVWKDSEPVIETITAMQNRWLDITNPRHKSKTIRLNPLKIENIKEERKESPKPVNWKDIEKTAVPIPSLQETSMPNFTNIGTKFDDNKEYTLTTLEKIKSYKQTVDSVRTDVKSYPEIRDHTLHTNSKTRQLQVDHEKDQNTLKAKEAVEENREPKSGDTMQVAKSSSTIVLAAHAVHPLENGDLPVSTETPSMYFVDLVMQVINRQPFNYEYECESSETQNEFVNIGNVETLSNKDQSAITNSSPCSTCKSEKHSLHAEKRKEQSPHAEIHPLDLNDETVPNNALNPAFALNTTKTKIEDIDHEEEEEVGPYIYPTETKIIKCIDHRKKYTDPTENRQDTDNKDFAVTAVKTNNEVNEDSPLITTYRKPMKDNKHKIKNKAEPEYKPEYRSEAYTGFKKETHIIPQQFFYSYCPSHYSHYINYPNVYQQSYLRFFIGLSEQYRHYYPCYQIYDNQDYAFYEPNEPYTNQTYAFYKSNTNHPNYTNQKGGVETRSNDRANHEMDKHKHANNPQESDIRTDVSARVNNDMEKNKHSKNSQESDIQTIVSTRANKEMDKQKHAINSQDSDIRTILSTRASNEMDKHKHARNSRELDIQTLISTRASHDVDNHTRAKNYQEFDIKTIVSAHLDLSKIPTRRIQGKPEDMTKIPTKRIQGKGNIRSHAEHVLKNRLPIETSIQRQVRLRPRPKRDSASLGDKSEPKDMLEKDLPLSVILEKVRERNRKEQVLQNLSLLEGEPSSSKKGGRDKSPPTPSCPPPEPPRRSPPVSLPPSGDNIPKFCPPKEKNGAKFFDMLSTLSVYDNDNPSERSISAGKRRELEKRLLGEVGVGINRWIFVQDKAQPWIDSETENILECSKESVDENDVENLWFENIRLC